MGLEEVKREILDNAKREAKVILSEADAEKKEIMVSAEKRADELRSMLDEEAKLTIEQYKVMVSAETASSVNKERLALEKEIIDEVSSIALEELEGSKNREKHLKKMQTFLKQGYSKVYCNENDLKMVKGAVKFPISGGLVLEDSAGEIRLDLSYDTLLKEIKQESLSEVAKILF
jgi:V/A-type H+-transporting ATPase subunit E